MADINVDNLRDRNKAFGGKSIEEIADFMIEKAERLEGTVYYAGHVEFMYRQTKAQQDAACATEATAKYTKQYTRYVFWTVVIMAVSMIAKLIIECAQL